MRRSCIAPFPPPPPGRGSRCSGPFVQGGAPTLEVDVTDYGYRYVGMRPLEDGQTYVRTYHFIMPFTQIRPQQFRMQSEPASDRGLRGTSGCRWMMRIAWCGTGCIASGMSR